MTLKIEVEIPVEHIEARKAGTYLENALAAIGYSVREAPPLNAEPLPDTASATVAGTPGPDRSPTGAEPGKTQEDRAAKPIFRERNKPGNGKGRRTKEEIAEDKELDDLVAQAGLTDAEVDKALAEIGHRGLIEELKVGEPETQARQISETPEDRTDPNDAAQDKADEAAEVEAGRNPEKPLTEDDLRAVMSHYVDAHGMPATQEDGPRIFKDALGDPPAGNEGWKMSLVAAEGQEVLAKAVRAWTAAVDAGKRYGAE